MPNLLHVTPKYRLHKPSGQAVVTLNGVDHYLGPWQSKNSSANTTAWWANGWREVAAWAPEGSDTSVTELCAAYWTFAKGYYRKDGQPTRSIERIRVALRHLRKLYGETAIAEFGPLALQSLQQGFVREGKSRKYVNYLTAEVKRAFKWGVTQEIVPAAVWHALTAVPGFARDARKRPSPCRCCR